MRAVHRTVRGTECGQRNRTKIAFFGTEYAGDSRPREKAREPVYPFYDVGFLFARLRIFRDGTERAPLCD